MRNIFLIIILLVSLTLKSQTIRFAEVQYTSINVGFDPYASYTEKGIDVIGEIERVQNWGYVKGGLELFPKLDGEFVFLYSAIGLNFKLGYFDNWRLYGGVKAGTVYRGRQFYANFGLESGLLYDLDNGIIVGGKVEYIRREDFLYWGGTPEMVGSGYLIVVFKINTKRYGTY